MGNGKIVFWPPPFQAISLDGYHYLTLAAAWKSTIDLLGVNISGAPDIGAVEYQAGTVPADPGATLNFPGDFCIDALLYVDIFCIDAESWIIGKSPLDLANLRGWQFFHEASTRRLGLRLNDGQAVPVTVYSSAGAFNFNEFFHARVEVNRSGSAIFYVNGVAMGGGDISSVGSSLANDEVLRIGAYDASNKRFMGAIGFLRLDNDRVPGADDAAAEWARLKYGYPREASDCFAVWDFNGTLADLSSGYTLAWQGGGSPVYVAGYPVAPVSFIFTENFTSKFERGFVDPPDAERAEDHTLRRDIPYIKRRYRLPFTTITEEQAIALESAWAASGGLVDLYLDSGNRRTCRGLIINQPTHKGQFYGHFEGELVIEEL
jgi:hypothetical protein